MATSAMGYIMKAHTVWLVQIGEFTNFFTLDIMLQMCPYTEKVMLNVLHFIHNAKFCLTIRKGIRIILLIDIILIVVYTHQVELQDLCHYFGRYSSRLQAAGTRLFNVIHYTKVPGLKHTFPFRTNPIFRN